VCLQESAIEDSSVEDKNTEVYKGLSYTNLGWFLVFVLLLICKVSFTWTSVENQDKKSSD